MFTTNHFIWLAICFIMIGSLLVCSIKFQWSLKTCIYIMCGISIVSELSKIFTHIKFVNGSDWSEGGVITPNALPLHLCSIFIFVFFYLALSKNEKIKKRLISFFVPVGIAGAFLALMMATSGVAFNKPQPYQCFIYHSGMIWLALYLLITKQVDLGLKSFILNVIMLFCLAIIMIWINGALRTYDTNFFFIVRPPVDNLPILNLNHGWYVYFAHLGSIGVILETLMSLPYIIKERKQKKVGIAFA